ncbi:MAG: hypothetical protein HOV80_01800 [Polyangiaceae bacterium]|nr:hypothetical protein [Polyangiaceae bacterium]
MGLGDTSGVGAGPQATSTSDATTGSETGPTTTSGGGGGGPGVGGAGGSGVTTTGGGGGEGPTGCTIDGAIDANETCEDGNLTAGDGCDPTCHLEATCGNGMAEGGEPCDDGTVCDDSCLGSCQAGMPLAVGATTNGSTSGGISTFPNCAPFSTGPMRTYRIETAPHPEGVLVLATNANNTFDPVLWVARDCGNVLGCDDDVSSQNGVAGIRTAILPPSTKLVIGVADQDDNDFSFEVYYRPYRYFDEFASDPAGWTLGAWDSNGYALNTWNDPPGTADSPEIYVGGIQTIRVAFPYEISQNAGAEVSASFDGGAFSVVKTLPAAPNSNFDEVDGSFTLQRPAGAARLRLRFEYLGTQEGILIHRLEVGPDVPAPTF